MRMREPPASMYNARLSLGRGVVSILGLVSMAAGVFLATALSAPGRAESPDISAQRLLSSWQDGDPSMSMVAEMIAGAFASGFSWGEDAGKHVYCARPEIKGHEIMTAFEAFLERSDFGLNRVGDSRIVFVVIQTPGWVEVSRRCRSLFLKICATA
jgi:hypothetical protein